MSLPHMLHRHKDTDENVVKTANSGNKSPRENGLRFPKNHDDELTYNHIGNCE